MPDSQDWPSLASVVAAWRGPNREINLDTLMDDVLRKAIALIDTGQLPPSAFCLPNERPFEDIESACFALGFELDNRQGQIAKLRMDPDAWDKYWHTDEGRKWWNYRFALSLIPGGDHQRTDSPLQETPNKEAPAGVHDRSNPQRSRPRPRKRPYHSCLVKAVIAAVGDGGLERLNALSCPALAESVGPYLDDPSIMPASTKARLPGHRRINTRYPTNWLAAIEAARAEARDELGRISKAKSRPV